jgi:hypothetical protein
MNPVTPTFGLCIEAPAIEGGPARGWLPVGPVRMRVAPRGASFFEGFHLTTWSLRVRAGLLGLEAFLAAMARA